jgi:hypothetical protein
MKFCTLDLRRFVFKYSEYADDLNEKIVYLQSIKDVILEKDPVENLG